MLQTGQTPCVAGLPFFIVIALASFISRLALHLTQYPSAILSTSPLSELRAIAHYTKDEPCFFLCQAQNHLFCAQT